MYTIYNTGLSSYYVWKSYVYEVRKYYLTFNEYESVTS